MSNNALIEVNLESLQHQIAKNFASQQASREKFKQVYLNTLAVYAVKNFLDWAEFETDLEAGDSWNSIIRRFNDVADLVIPDVGKLECRRVLPGETIISLPPEVTEDRIAYVLIGFNEHLNKVDLLGFVPSSDEQEMSEISRDSLQPIDDLIDYLQELEFQAFSEENTQTINSTTTSTQTNLSPIEKLKQWYSNLLETGWLDFQSNRELAFAVRGSASNDKMIKTEKIIDLGENQPVKLELKLTSQSTEETEATISVYPNGDSKILPTGLQVIILDEFGNTILEDVVKSGAKSIDFQIALEPNEHFSIKLILGDIIITENV